LLVKQAEKYKRRRLCVRFSRLKANVLPFFPARMELGVDEQDSWPGDTWIPGRWKFFQVSSLFTLPKRGL